MKLTARIDLLSNSTTASPRRARLTITGEGDEYECDEVLNALTKINAPKAEDQRTANNTGSPQLLLLDELDSILSTGYEVLGKLIRLKEISQQLRARA